MHGNGVGCAADCIPVWYRGREKRLIVGLLGGLLIAAAYIDEQSAAEVGVGERRLGGAHLPLGTKGTKWYQGY
jgi:hypothetical protein